MSTRGALWSCRQPCTVFDRLFLFFQALISQRLYFTLLYCIYLPDWAPRRLIEKQFCPFPGPPGCVTRSQHGYLEATAWEAIVRLVTCLLDSRESAMLRTTQLSWAAETVDRLVWKLLVQLYKIICRYVCVCVFFFFLIS